MHPRLRPGSLSRVAFAWLITVGLTAGLPAHGAGTPGANAEEVPAGQTATDTAEGHYQQGLAAKARAVALETEARSATGEDGQEPLLAEARALYGEAVTWFGKALKLKLDYYEAANELGFSLRKTGDYRKALGAYNFALTIKPDFYPAIEYRGEAFLALGMIDEAKDAYMTLFRNDPALASQLLTIMAERISEQPDEDGFGDWVAERQAMAAVTPGADVSAERSW
jgi:tetratricopeptide (TPR) repeat protein